MGLDVNTTITYTVNTGHTKAETTFGIEACNTVLVSDSYQHVRVYSHAEYVLHNISKIPPQFGLYLLFCIVSNCQFKVDLWEVLLLGSNFTRQYANRFGNKEMKFIANIESKKDGSCIHYICWLVKNLFV